jgi:riboflavin-specific deaminase-like protein
MTEPLLLRRLLPEPGSATPAQAAAHLAGREVLLLNMVTSLDGHTTVAGRSRGLRGGQGDRELFHALRAHADAILVGTATMRAESYGAWLRDERRRAMRRAAGLAGGPVGATVTRRGEVPWEIPLFAQRDAQVIVYSGVPLTCPPEVVAHVEIVVLEQAGDDLVTAAVADLRARGLRSILCEGGATLNAALLRAGLVDELELVLAPQIVGGTDALTAVHGPLDGDVTVEPVDAYECQGALLLRYRVAAAL